MESLSFKCSTCQIYLYGIANYQRHVNSLEHANQIHLKTLENITDEDKVCCSSKEDSIPQVSTSNNHVQEPMDTSATMVFNSLLKCDLCQKQFTGNEPYQQHLESAGHKKKLATSLNSNQSNLSGYRKCDICDKNFSGPAPYEQHMVSSLHKKKVIVKELNGVENPFSSFLAQCETDSKSHVQSKISQDADRSGSSSQVNSLRTASIQNNYARWKCDICDKCFSGPAPYDQHMSSNVHMKKVRERNIFNNMQNKTSNTESVLHNMGNNVSFSSQSQLKCEVCDKTFSGPVPLQQHLSSLQHEKKLNQVKFLNLPTTNSNDQVDSTSDTRKASALPDICTNGHKQASGLSEDLNKPHQLLPTLSTNQIDFLQFQCLVCDKSFNGRVPYDQHMSSILHKKKVLQKTPLPSGENKSSLENEMPNSQWYCKMCDKLCSGSVPFTQHEMSEAHCKKMRLAEINGQLQEIKDVNSPRSAPIAEQVNENCSEGSLFQPIENRTERMPPPTRQNNSDLILGDILKDLNFITPETMNVTTFNVDDKIVFDVALR